MSLSPLVAWQFYSWPEGSDQCELSFTTRNVSIAGLAELVGRVFSHPVLGRPAATVIISGFGREMGLYHVLFTYRKLTFRGLLTSDGLKRLQVYPWTTAAELCKALMNDAVLKT